MTYFFRGFFAGGPDKDARFGSFDAGRDLVFSVSGLTGAEGLLSMRGDSTTWGESVGVESRPVSTSVVSLEFGVGLDMPPAE